MSTKKTVMLWLQIHAFKGCNQNYFYKKFNVFQRKLYLHTYISDYEKRVQDVTSLLTINNDNKQYANRNAVKM